MSPFDFVAAVAVGAIVGRVPNADTTSYLEGAITLVTLLAAHRLLMWLRFRPGFARLIDHSPRVLVTRGEVRGRELRRCGLTAEDLHSLLRQQGVGDLESVRYAIYEKRGQLPVIRQGGPDGGGPPPLVEDVVARQ
ncbi:DUF421 domain-containing protein [Corallococcus sp. EGB]|uniref:DUF421 domain-containing protein n=1 Tax=Corallococcus sp. EGB TaxID=1521117 RepID=UPI001CBB8C4C|nr:YetF domain-containing protein [Corallococcus sp. EGB]